MSGHSKWSTIKRKKGANDAARGKLFTKLIREITIAAKSGGGDVEANPRLRTAVEKAKANSMPKDNIDRGIKKGIGDLDGVKYEEFTYEGYGPGGVALMVHCLSDNRNRTTADVRHSFTKYGGNLGETGCVGYLFDRRGVFTFDAEKVEEEIIMEAAIEAGAEDIKEEDGDWVVYTDPVDFETVREKLNKIDLSDPDAEITMVPQTTLTLTGKAASSALKLVDLLEENDDVQNVYTNFDIPEEVLAALEIG